ncbi:MAG: hypothetical protein ACTJHU_11560 [Mycetocola sp.]
MEHSDWDDRLEGIAFSLWAGACSIVVLSGIAALVLALFGIALPPPMLSSAFFVALALVAAGFAAHLFPVAPYLVYRSAADRETSRLVASRGITVLRRVGSVAILALVALFVLAAIAVPQGWLV